MSLQSLAATLFLLACPLPCIAADAGGSASGSGSLTHWIFEQKDGQAVYTGKEMREFSPRYAYAYDEESKVGKLRWILLSDKEMPVASRMSSDTAGKAALAWCKEQSGSFVALRLRADGKIGVIDCAGDGVPKSQSNSVMNDVASIQPSFELNDAAHVKGRLLIGQPACGVANGSETKWDLCEIYGDYRFEAAVTAAK